MRREWLVISSLMMFVYIINFEAFQINTHSKLIPPRTVDQLDWTIT